MPVTTNPEWLRLALYAVGIAAVLTVLLRTPYLGRLVRTLLSVAMLALVIFLIMQQAPYQPELARLMARMGLDGQQVAGDEVRIRASHDGHYWAQVSINGTQRRMLIDSGATITAISAKTAAEAGVEADTTLVPIIMQTANGAVPAKTATLDALRVGTIEARKLKVVIAPALGNFDVLGMNFLSQLASWRVEKGVLILVPERAAGERDREAERG